MTNLRVLDAVAADKYLKASGAGTDVDPHIPEHKETSAAGILAAAQAIQTAAAAIQAAVEVLDNIVAGSEAQVDVLTMPSVTVTGALTDTELRASAVPVSGTVTASGPLTDTQLRNTAVPVSATALPLPTGAATSAKQDTAAGKLDSLLTELQAKADLAETQPVSLAALPALAAGTAAIGKLAANSGVDIGDVDVASSALPTGAATSAKQDTEIGHLATLAGAVAGTEAQVDVVSSALPTGASTAANQTTLIGHVDGVETALGTLLTDTQLRASAVPVSGTVTATVANATIASGTVAVSSLPALAAGTNNIGDVDVLTLPALPAGTNNIGDVDVLSVIPGTAATNLGKAEDAAHTSGDVGVMALGVRNEGHDDFSGTDKDYVPIAVNASGDVFVNVRSLPALAAGTNAIGKLAANSGVDIGDVDVASIAAGTNTIGATRDAGPAWTSVFGVSGVVVTSADATGIVAVTDAPTSGQKIVVTDIVVSVGATAMQVDFEVESAASTHLLTLYMAADSTVQITPRGRLKLPTADKKLTIDTSAAGNISVGVWFYSEA